MAVLAIHGTPACAELRDLGITPEDVTIFSSNINPYGPPPTVVDAVQSAAIPDRIALYPDRFSYHLVG